MESAVENAHLKRNAPGFSKKRHFFGCKDHRALTVDEKNSDRMDFLDANRLRVGNGRNPARCAAFTSFNEGENSGGIKRPKQRK